MSFVIFHKETTRYLRTIRQGYWADAVYEREQDAKAGLTIAKRKIKSKLEKLSKSKVVTYGRDEQIKKLNAELAALESDYEILPMDEFKKIEKTEVRHGIVAAAGKEFNVPVNTPWTSGPWSETYWCS